MHLTNQHRSSLFPVPDESRLPPTIQMHSISWNRFCEPHRRAPVEVRRNRNRDFSVYQLRNAGSEEVSETLKSVYESRAGMLAFGSVVIVPEPRMNALIVYGGRTDRDRIEQLLEILDTEKLPDSGRIFRTQVIPVKHADAEKVEIVLKGVYRTEMSAGGSRRSHRHSDRH